MLSKGFHSRKLLPRLQRDLQRRRDKKAEIIFPNYHSPYPDSVSKVDCKPILYDTTNLSASTRDHRAKRLNDDDYTLLISNKKLRLETDFKNTENENVSLNSVNNRYFESVNSVNICCAAANSDFFPTIDELRNLCNNCCIFGHRHQESILTCSKAVGFTPSLSNLLESRFVDQDVSTTKSLQQIQSATVAVNCCGCSLSPCNNESEVNTDRTLTGSKDAMNLWHPSLEGTLKLHILAATALHGVKLGQKVFVCCALYHGMDLLSQVVSSREVPVTLSRCSVSSGSSKHTFSLEDVSESPSKEPADRVSVQSAPPCVGSNTKFSFEGTTCAQSYQCEADCDNSREAEYCCTDELCEQIRDAVSGGKLGATWSEWLELDVNLQDCPRATKLCVTVVLASGTKEEPGPVLGCSSLPLFDWRGRLALQGARHNRVQEVLLLQPTNRSTAGHLTHDSLTRQQSPFSQHQALCSVLSYGDNSVSSGAAADDLSHYLYPDLLGSELETLARRGSLFLSLERRLTNCPVQFPTLRQMIAYANTSDKISSLAQGDKPVSQLPYTSPSDADLSFLCEVSELDPFVPLSRAELQRLWKLRSHCHRTPATLPRLLQAVDWRDRDVVCQLYLMLSQWSHTTLPISVCLEVLQPRYPDPVVRYTAVQALARGLSDHQLQMYLLQLVQCLLQETYWWSPLLHLLLHRALTNTSIGHLLFHHIKCCGVSRRALAVLEAYCRGVCPSLLRHTVRQVAMMNFLGDTASKVYAATSSGSAAAVASGVPSASNGKEQELQRVLTMTLSSPVAESVLQELPSPICPFHWLGRVKVSSCAVLPSAKRPLRIVWENSDPHAHLFTTTYSLIFKRGDDLRQDQLSLQVLGVMANIWSQEGLHLRVTPYTCLAMSGNMGLIELVSNAKTVYSIQRRARLGAIQVDSSQLYKWIKEHNRGPRLAQAVDTFTQSCAAYCVATFVLGIGDRHPDNIMVSEEGHIFHIDFGHFLGNFKKKFGVPRERVPFVLTQDFLRVIASGAENPKDSPAFQQFEQLCGEAYIALRRHSRLLLSLFALLLHSGLPELQNHSDLAYLHRSLGVWCKTEEEALQFFKHQFCQASGGAWTTKLDWFFHSVKHR